MEKIFRTFCNNCLNKTDHILIFNKKISGSEPYDKEYDILWSDTFELFER